MYEAAMILWTFGMAGFVWALIESWQETGRQHREREQRERLERMRQEGRRERERERSRLDRKRRERELLEPRHWW